MTATLDDILTSLNQLNTNLKSKPSPWDDEGVATGGSTTFLVDNSKNWAVNLWYNGLIYVTIDGTTYRTFATGNVSNQLNLYPVLPTEIKAGSSYKIHNVVTQVSGGQFRPGINLTSHQRIVEFVYTSQDIQLPSPYIPWVQGPIPHGGTMTAATNPSVMTDTAATLTPSTLIGQVIYDITDHSSGTIIANTATTVTVAALSGGTLNTFTHGDSYVFGIHLINIATGLLSPYNVLAGTALSIIEQRLNFNQDMEGWLYIDGMLVAEGAGASGGSMIDQSNIAYFTTLLVDPTAAKSHILDYQIVNRGLSDMIGGVTETMILEQM